MPPPQKQNVPLPEGTVVLSSNGTIYLIVLSCLLFCFLSVVYQWHAGPLGSPDMRWGARAPVPPPWLCHWPCLLPCTLLTLLCVLPSVRRPFWSSDVLLVTGALLDAQHLAPRSHSTHSAYSWLPDILVVTRPSLATLRHPGYSEPFGALLVTQRFSTCHSPLASRNRQWPSWSLLALLVARRRPPGWHVPGDPKKRAPTLYARHFLSYAFKFYENSHRTISLYSTYHAKT